MIIIQRRVFDNNGKTTDRIGFYAIGSYLKGDRLFGELRDGKTTIEFARGVDTNYQRQVFRRLGMTTKAIREQDDEGVAAYAWGYIDIIREAEEEAR